MDADAEPGDPHAEVVVARFADAVSPWMLCAWLRDREIPAQVRCSDSVSLGMGRVARVEVPARMVARARWLIDAATPTDTEAWLMATGELDPGAARAAFRRGSRTRSVFARVAAVSVVLGFSAWMAAVALSR